jgi:nucleotide-binding universal stress UspA family protein
MPHRTGDFKRALAAVDSEARAERVVPWVRRLVVPGGEIHLLTVLPPARALVSPEGTAYADRLEAAGRLSVLASLGFLAGRLRADGVRSTGHVRFGEPVAEILALARQIDVDLIALAVPRGHRWWRVLRAGVTERVVGRAAVPVLITAGLRGA